MKTQLFNSFTFFLLISIGVITACSKEEAIQLQSPETEVNSNSNADSILEISTRSAPVINSITGDTYLPYVSQGKWQGNVCNQGNYYGYYVINTIDVNDVSNFWNINGSGFGSSPGSVVSLTSGVTVQLISWSNTVIKVRPVSSYALDYKTGVTLKVTPVSGPYVTKSINVLGMLKKGRGFGQCTWEAAFQRKVAGKSVPSPSAYSSTGNITVAYVPQKYDVVHWNNQHTGIILTTPTVSTSNGITTYTFQLRERNHTCNETATTTTKSFKKTSSSIVQGIKSANSTLGSATKYWR